MKQTIFFYLNELWQSWRHHGVFSDTSRQDCLDKINQSQHAAHKFLRSTDWLIITLGSAFSYMMKERKWRSRIVIGLRQIGLLKNC